MKSNILNLLRFFGWLGMIAWNPFWKSHMTVQNYRNSKRGGFNSLKRYKSSFTLELDSNIRIWRFELVTHSLWPHKFCVIFVTKKGEVIDLLLVLLTRTALKCSRVAMSKWDCIQSDMFNFIDVWILGTWKWHVISNFLLQKQRQNAFSTWLKYLQLKNH